MTNEELLAAIYRMAGAIEGIVGGYNFILKQREVSNEEMIKILDELHVLVQIEFNKVEKSTIRKVG
jgi:hypothetical protein